jgi:hypothetical protein
MGHESSTITERKYMHLFDRLRMRCRQAMALHPGSSPDSSVGCLSCGDVDLRLGAGRGGTLEPGTRLKPGEDLARLVEV